MSIGAERLTSSRGPFCRISGRGGCRSGRGSSVASMWNEPAASSREVDTSPLDEKLELEKLALPPPPNPPTPKLALAVTPTLCDLPWMLNPLAVLNSETFMSACRKTRLHWYAVGMKKLMSGSFCRTGLPLSIVPSSSLSCCSYTAMVLISCVERKSAVSRNVSSSFFCDSATASPTLLRNPPNAGPPFSSSSVTSAEVASAARDAAARSGRATDFPFPLARAALSSSSTVLFAISVKCAAVSFVSTTPSSPTSSFIILASLFMLIGLVLVLFDSDALAMIRLPFDDAPLGRGVLSSARDRDPRKGRMRSARRDCFRARRGRRRGVRPRNRFCGREIASPPSSEADGERPARAGDHSHGLDAFAFPPERSSRCSAPRDRKCQWARIQAAAARFLTSDRSTRPAAS